MKIIKATVIIVFLFISIIIMESGSYIKNRGLDMPGLLEDIKESVNDENYELALEKTKAAQEGFKKIAKRIQFSVEFNELNAFSHSLSKLEGALLAANKDLSLVEIYLLENYWDSLA